MRAAVRITILLALTVASAACVPTGPNGTILPLAPAATAPPTTTMSFVVPTSWSVPTNPDGSCPTASAPTITQDTWDAYLTDIANLFGLPNPTRATVTGIDFQFPAGCYAVSDGLTFDAHHPLVDVAIDGAYTGVPANSPQFTQVQGLTCVTALPMMSLINNVTTRVAINGVTLIGSSPDTSAYCGNAMPGMRITGTRGTAGIQDVTLSNNTVRNNWGDNIYIGTVTRLTVENNTLVQGGRNSLGIVAGNDLIVRNNTIRYAGGPSIEVETNNNSDSIARVLIQNNVVSYGNASGAGTAQNNGLSLGVVAAQGTTITDVAFLDNRTESALTIWLRTGSVTPGTPIGAVHRVSLRSNTTTSRSGQIMIAAGDQITITDNKILSGPPVELWDAAVGSGYWWTHDPPRIIITTPPLIAAAPCGADVGNTYVDSAGATQYWRTIPYGTVDDYVMQPC